MPGTAHLWAASKKFTIPGKITGVKQRTMMYNTDSEQICTDEEERYAAALETAGRRRGAGRDADR